MRARAGVAGEAVAKRGGGILHFHFHFCATQQVLNVENWQECIVDVSKREGG